MQAAGPAAAGGDGVAAVDEANGAAAAAATQALADVPAEHMYADVLRGLRCLRRLDLDVTGLCKVMKLSSSALADVCELRLHMLGSVVLPPGGLPCLPRLTHLEFYLPGERNWGALSLWVRSRSSSSCSCGVK